VTPDHDAEMDALAAQLEAAGIITIRTCPDGQVEYQLTQIGTQLGRRLAMTGDEDEAQALLDAFMEKGPTPEEARPSRDGPI
jgi:threonine synthase